MFLDTHIYILLIIGSYNFSYGNNSNNTNTTYKYDSINYKQENEINYSNKNKYLFFLKQSLKTAKDNKILDKEINFTLLLSNYYTKLIKYDSAQYFLQEAIKLCKENQFECQEINATTKMAALYYNKCNYSKAIEWYFIALDKTDNCPNNEVKSDIYSNIGNVYFRIKDYSKSLEYLEYSLKLNKKDDNSKSIIKTYNNLGNVYADFHNHDSALKYYKIALKKSSKINYTKYLAISNANIAGIYREEKEYNQALQYAFRAYKYDSVLNYFYGIAADYNEIAFSYKGQKKYPSALKYLRKSLKIMDSISAYDLKINLLKDFSSTYSELGDFKSALFYYKRYTHLKDSLVNENKNKQIVDAETKYKTQLKNNKIHQLKFKNIQNKNIQKIFLLIIGALFITALFLVVFFRLKVKTNAILNKKNNQLTNLNATQNRLMSIISHDFKAPLSAFYSITSSLKTKFDKIDREDINNYLNHMLNSSIALKLQLENMLNWAINQSHEISVTKNFFNLSILVTKVIVILQEFANERQVTIKNTIKENIEINTDGRLLSIVLNNLITNAVKFSESGSSVIIKSFSQEGNLVLSIKDFGVGISENNIANIFNNRNNTQKDKESDTGLGLIVSKDIVTKLGGEIWVESKIGVGSEFFIKFTDNQYT